MIKVILLMLVSTVSFAAVVSGPDTDTDGVLDFKSCALEDDGLFCEEMLDNCTFVANPTQRVSPNYMGDSDKTIGTACDLDINRDGVQGDSSDYNLLLGLVASYQQMCINYSTYEYYNIGNCDPSINQLGDLNDDGRINNGDMIEFANRTGR